MAKQPSFRRTAPPTAPQLREVTVPPEVMAQMPRLDPTLPVPRGQLMLTDYTRQQLSKLGWQEGDPIPGDFATRVKEVQQAFEEERANAKHDIPAGWQPVQPKTVQIDELPPEQQAELRQYLSDYKKQAAADTAVAQQQAAAEASINPASPPSVQEAHRVALAASQAQRPGFAFVNDMPAAPEGKAVGGVTGVSPVFQKMADAKQPPATPPSEPVKEEPATAGLQSPVTHCPRCKWDTRMAFYIEPTDDDKIVFRAAILGGGRFKKEISTLDGGLKIRFRGLSSGEIRILREQLRYDAEAGKILGDGEFWAEMMEYRLIMAVEQIIRGQDIFDVDPVEKIEYDPPKPGEPRETVLVKLREWFYENIIPTEAMAHIVREHHQQFNRLLEYLETMSQEPSFFKGIASGR
jgi:hypothetical protein